MSRGSNEFTDNTFIAICAYKYVSQKRIRVMRMLCITGWRRLMGSRKLQIIFHNRATKYRSLLQKMTYKDQGSYESWPPCTRCCVSKQVMCIEKVLCIEPKDVVYPPQKLLGDGLSTPVPLFCLICTISRTKRVFWISTTKTNFDSAGADTSGRVRHVATPYTYADCK